MAEFKGECLCGAQLFTKTANNPDGIAVVAASLDNPDIFSPQVSVYASNATPWDPPRDALGSAQRGHSTI